MAAKCDKRNMSRKSKAAESSSSADEDAESGGEEYEVEKIIGSKKVGGKTFYKVVWKGFPLEEATWEPISNLKGSAKLIKEYKNNEFKSFVSGNYQKRILQVLHAEKKGNDVVYSVVLKDNSIETISSEEAQKSCPQKIIDYYIDLLGEIKRKKNDAEETKDNSEEKKPSKKNAKKSKKEKEEAEVEVEVKEEEKEEPKAEEVKEKENEAEEIIVVPEKAKEGEKEKEAESDDAVNLAANE